MIVHQKDESIFDVLLSEARSWEAKEKAKEVAASEKRKKANQKRLIKNREERYKQYKKLQDEFETDKFIS